MRTVSFYRTALARQVGEAVHIRRRGGAGSILNSKSEFDRCKIPRLTVEQEDEEEVKKALEEELHLDKLIVEEQANSWGATQYRARKEQEIGDLGSLGSQPTKTSRSRQDDDMEDKDSGRAKKKRRYKLLDDNWGEEGQDPGVEEGYSSTQAPETILLPSQAPDGSSEAPRTARRQSSILDFVSTIPARPPTQPLSEENVDTTECSVTTEIRDQIPSITVDNTTATPVLSIPSTNTGTEDKKTSLSPRTVPSSGDTAALDVCKPDKRGLCVLHDILMKKTLVTSKYWGDRGRGRGFGWKTTKTPKYSCVSRVKPVVLSQNQEERLRGTQADNIVGSVGKVGVVGEASITKRFSDSSTAGKDLQLPR